MIKPVPSKLLLPIVAAFGFVPASAYAGVGFAVLPQITVALSESRCDAALSPAIGAANSGSPRGISKMSAILGGQPSNLERIMGVQAGKAMLADTAAPVAELAGRGPGLARWSTCAQQPALALAQPKIGGHFRSARTDGFLGSLRLPIMKTGFDAAWARVQNQPLSHRTASALAHVGGGKPDLASLVAVNAWANAKIRYVEDHVLYGKADYWASAQTTLHRRAGDCEDIAITKLQLLAAIGIPRSDMFLTVARDLVRNADHALLIVKLDGRSWVLDNSTNQLLDASLANDYRPIMSFSATGKWLHGYSQQISAR
jgi:predicted transglutaminase-like cysteine proteinase